MAAESHHDGTLRGAIAASVNVGSRITTEGAAARIASSGSRMPPGEENLAAYANRGSWRHPVFGDATHGGFAGPWVRQDWPSARGWFFDGVKENEPVVRREIIAALDDLTSHLTGKP